MKAVKATWATLLGEFDIGIMPFARTCTSLWWKRYIIWQGWDNRLIALCFCLFAILFFILLLLSPLIDSFKCWVFALCSVDLYFDRMQFACILCGTLDTLDSRYKLGRE